jgi:hypothetical protein
MTGLLLRLGVALLLLLRAGAAVAGPFDTYQLIMWQERTPAQIEGMKRLGFTGTKLRATGGEVDPAELAQHQASGLPWYLENVATDFYAPYHRYVPGKSVTWLFDAAKARRRAEPSDTSVFIREPSLSDPEWLARISTRLQDLVREQSRFHPLFYDLADESGIGDLAAAWDADISAPSLAAMRAWLHTQYPSLPALNQQWGTRFEDWDQVVPELTDAALQRTDGNYSAWADFKAWMDVAFARAVRAGTDALHRADPNALAGLEGAQVPGWGGYDYSLLAPAVDVMEIYDSGNALELARAFNPHLIALRTSFGDDSAEAWRHLLQGGRGTIVWDEGDTITKPDGSPQPRGQRLAALVASIREVAPQIMASEPAFDPVAVLVSQASFRTQWLLDRRPGGAAWSDRDAAREYIEDNAWRAARRETLQRLLGIGIRPHLLSSSMLEAGALGRDGVRVLILPHAIALSDAEVQAIEAFAQSGGTVLADTEPGLFDGHSRLRAGAPLHDIARVPEAMLRTGTIPGPGTLDGEAGLLAAAGVFPRAVFRVADGNRAPGIEARWLRNGETELLSVQAIEPYAAPTDITVELAAPATVRDFRRGGQPQPTQRFHLTLDPVEPTILALAR